MPADVDVRPPRPDRAPGARVLVAALALGALACGDGAPRGPLDPVPGAHVVLISIDTLRADHLGCYGYERATSPNIDAFARDALLFERVYTSANNTGPSHMTMLTGLRPPVHGIDHTLPATRPAESVETLAEQLGAAGYRTLALADGGFVTAPFGFDRGFDVFESELKPFAHKLPTLRRWLAEPPTVPTLLFLHTYEPHAPYAPRPEHDLFSDPGYTGWFAGRVDRFRAAFAEDRPFEMGALEESFWPERRAEVLTPADRQHCIDLYDGDIHQIDDHLGEVLGLLRAAGYYDDAWIVITSDHGEAFGEHGTYEHRQLYDEELHVPLIVRPPGGLPGGMRVSATGRVVDLTPTILWAVGLPPIDGVQGRSLLPLGQRLERPVHAIAGESAELRAAIANGRKLIRRSGNRRELYDLEADPAERHDLLRDAAPPPWDAELSRLMDQLEAENRALRQAYGDPGDVGELDPAVLEQLRQLGYADGPAAQAATQAPGRTAGAQAAATSPARAEAQEPQPAASGTDGGHRDG